MQFHFGSCGSDGPNLNKTIWRELESKIKKTGLGFGNLVDVRTCNIHVMQNGFFKGLAEYGHEIKQFTIDLFSLFKYSAARREDYRNIQFSLDLEVQIFQKHTSVRWLSLGPCVRRIVKQLSGIIEYIEILQKIVKMPMFLKVQHLREKWSR
jgi:hypothetical protein